MLTTGNWKVTMNNPPMSPKSTHTPGLTPATEETKTLEAQVYATARNLRDYPRGANGLTPDSVKFSPEYRAAKSAYNKAFSALRNHNQARSALARATA